MPRFIRTRRVSLVVVGLALALGSARPASTEPTLRGVWVREGETRLYLEYGGSSRWLTVGRKVGDFSIEAYDATAEVAWVRVAGNLRSLPLIEPNSAGAMRGESDSFRRAVTSDLRALVLTACQYLIEQEKESVKAVDLIGAERPVFRLEAVANDTCDELTIRVGRAGPEMVFDGEAMPAAAFRDPFVIQVQPTQSLAAISDRLHIPLAQLRALNPELAGSGRFSAIQSVRLY